MRIWDAANCTETGKLSQGNVILCVAVCGENRIIAFGLKNRTLRVVDCVTKDMLFEDTEAHHDGIRCVSFSPDGSYMATGSWRGTIRVWNTRTWTRAGECLKGHKNWVKSVTFSPNGKKIASGSGDGTIRLWDVESATCVGISPKIASEMNSVSFTGDGDRIGVRVR